MKYTSKVLTAMIATIPATIAVMSTVSSFSISVVYDRIHVMQRQLHTVLFIAIFKLNPANVFVILCILFTIIVNNLVL